MCVCETVFAFNCCTERKHCLTNTHVHSLYVRTNNSSTYLQRVCMCVCVFLIKMDLYAVVDKSKKASYKAEDD